jgi:hypothetical protein
MPDAGPFDDPIHLTRSQADPHGNHGSSRSPLRASINTSVVPSTGHFTAASSPVAGRSTSCQPCSRIGRTQRAG